MIKIQIKKVSETVTEKEVQNGVYYFQTIDEDKEPEYWYKIEISNHPNLSSLSVIKVIKMSDYSDKYFVSVYDDSDYQLSYRLENLFLDEVNVIPISAETFSSKKREIITKLIQAV